MLTAAVALVLTLGAAAQADTITFSGDMANSTANLGDFSASLTYAASSSTAATLDISLKNTTPSAGGYLTAFVLNSPSGVTGVSQGSTFGTNFSLIGSATGNSVNGAPFGQFDFGASTGGSFEGGGSPNGGIPVGSTETFDFNLSGTGLTSLSASSFASALSDGTGAGMGDQYFVARFRGMASDGSDKVPAGPASSGTTGSSTTGSSTTGSSTTGSSTTGGGTTGPGPGGSPVVPEPLSLLLWLPLGLGVIVYGFWLYLQQRLVLRHKAALASRPQLGRLP